MKDKNHPFAYLIKKDNQFAKTRDLTLDDQTNRGILFKPKYNHSFDVNNTRHLKNPIIVGEEKQKLIVDAFQTIMREHGFGIQSNQLNDLISEKAGFKFSHL